MLDMLEIFGFGVVTSAVNSRTRCYVGGLGEVLKKYS